MDDQLLRDYIDRNFEDDQISNSLFHLGQSQIAIASLATEADSQAILEQICYSDNLSEEFNKALLQNDNDFVWVCGKELGLKPYSIGGNVKFVETDGGIIGFLLHYLQRIYR